jgi:hypothetical protein
MRTLYIYIKKTNKVAPNVGLSGSYSGRIRNVHTSRCIPKATFSGRPSSMLRDDTHGVAESGSTGVLGAEECLCSEILSGVGGRSAKRTIV